MKTIACLIICALCTLAASGAESRFAPILSEIRRYEAPPVDMGQLTTGTTRPSSGQSASLSVRPVPPVSFWERVSQLAEFDEQEVKDYCRIVDYSGHDARLKAGNALERLKEGIGLARTLELLARQERVARCLHRATGESDAFERTAIYKKILRSKLALKGSGE